MGCCSSEPRLPSEAILLNRIKTSIESNNPERLASYFLVYENYPNPTNIPLIDKIIVTIKSTSFTSLSYALWLGHVKIFRYLYEKKFASVLVMEEGFKASGMSGLEIICQRGFRDMFDYYMPIFIEKYPSLSFPKDSLTIVQKICEAGNLSMLSAIISYFADKKDIPEQLDIHYQNPDTNENCALVACKTANIVIIKYLANECKADFTKKTSNGKNAIDLICTSGKPNSVYLSCAEFLIKGSYTQIPEKIEDNDLNKLVIKINQEIMTNYLKEQSVENN
ncbi:hypothetical protein SteCoe_21348 [Stentor coeruleus]|uniref:Ankyrin repeat protein n=1 Tax=Stentor coeruleus TaxID=5963 RepID=A0A1R2BPW1_9CILI|nr:hypothetical protein SteCoe_21348 [Stentor coeruleus]